MVAARRRAELEELAREIGALAVVTDVADAAQCRRLMEAAVNRLGGIDVLVCNAGISMWAPFDQITDPEVFRRLLEVNYLGTVYCVMAALEPLRASRGTIVAVSSAQAVLGLPHHTAYSGAKHAVRGFLGALEVELDGEVNFLEVMPGWVKGTELRATALAGDGSEIGESRRSHGSDAVTVEECSARIVEALRTGQRDLYVPAKYRVLPWLKLLAPRWLRKRIRRAVHRE